MRGGTADGFVLIVVLLAIMLYLGARERARAHDVD